MLEPHCKRFLDVFLPDSHHLSSCHSLSKTLSGDVDIVFWGGGEQSNLLAASNDLSHHPSSGVILWTISDIFTSVYSKNSGGFMGSIHMINQE